MHSILRRLLAACVLLCGVGGFMAPAATAGNPAPGNPTPPTGERINLFDSFDIQIVYPANTPFYVEHGWFPEVPGVHGIGIYSFELTVDGQALRPIIVNGFLPGFHDGPGAGVSQRSLFNFPAGLSAGTHLLVGRWYGPCSELVNSGYIDGPCPIPNARTLGFEVDAPVIFTP